MKKCSIMLQGTASTVGKSILGVGLCRIFHQDGYDVTPFKSQNMSLNSWITPEGHEMGRAQVIQAEAANKVPSSKMNPILLKPTSDRKSQVIFKGKVHETMDAVDYFAYKPRLREEISNIYHELQDNSDIMVIEGAGSPAEINLKEQDIVNMGMAEIADAPVVLIGDIDKGGVFASLVGTLMLLTEEERKRVKGVIINKFRGSVEILKPGLKQLEDIIKIPVLGVIPYFNLDIEDEDSVTDWEKFSRNDKGDLEVAVIKLPYMSNFTDFNALTLHPDVKLRFVELNEELGQPHLIIIPGSKATVDDLTRLRETGIEQQIIEAYEKGSHIFGICGGYQMLGKQIIDQYQVETNKECIDGLGLLDTVTHFHQVKTTTLSTGTESIFNETVQGYEIHMGETRLGESCIPLINKEDGSTDGCLLEDRTVVGTYFHGIFDNSKFTRKYLNYVREQFGKEPIREEIEDYWKYKQEQYDKLADIVRENLDMDKIYDIVWKEGIGNEELRMSNEE